MNPHLQVWVAGKPCFLTLHFPTLTPRAALLGTDPSLLRLHKINPRKLSTKAIPLTTNVEVSGKHRLARVNMAMYEVVKQWGDVATQGQHHTTHFHFWSMDISVGLGSLGGVGSLPPDIQSGSCCGTSLAFHSHLLLCWSCSNVLP